MTTQTLAVAGLYTSGTQMVVGSIAMLTAIAFVIGTVAAFGARKEGAAAAIKEQALTIVWAAMIVVGLGITAALVNEFGHHGIKPPAGVDIGQWGQ